MHCLFCDHDLSDRRTRPAFDPWLGRLWRVCPACRRWNVVPLEERWEAMEAYERTTRARGRSLLRTANLDLVDVEGQQLIRVGRAPRPELAGWRYAHTLPESRTRGLLAWLRRLVLGVPASSLGYNAGHGIGLFEAVPTDRWFASPFLDDAHTLTAAFLHVPLADHCPACASPMAVAPWQFQTLRLTGGTGDPHLIAECGICGTVSSIAATAARPALRLGLGIVNRRLTHAPLVEEAAVRLERSEGPEGLLYRFAREEMAIGELSGTERVAMGMALDEQSEAELLEAEWREAEELAAIVDGELTQVEGFDDFRRRVLG